MYRLPLAELLGTHVTETTADRVVAEMEVRPELYTRACPQLTASGRLIAAHPLRLRVCCAGESRLPHSAVNRHRVICGRFRRGGFFGS